RRSAPTSGRLRSEWVAGMVGIRTHSRQIWLDLDKKRTLCQTVALIDDYRKCSPETIRGLEEGLESSLFFYDFPEVDKKRNFSTNKRERLKRTEPSSPVMFGRTGYARVLGLAL
ncbi:MAG: hypothetical protein IMZ61_01965, partial [Planctomycetes bacterium]|nr:hypothetical protein [Planctomycetota bacterium]